MAFIDKPDLCTLAEYEKALRRRMREGELTDGQILNLYMRLAARDLDAFKCPIQVKVGQLATDIALIAIDPEDLRPNRGVKPIWGDLIDGVWNERIGEPCAAVNVERRGLVRGFNAVFLEYDDGIDRGPLEKKKALTGAVSGATK